MRVTYFEAAQTDLIRQFRYYLVERDLAEVALRFREAVRGSAEEISRNPRIAPPYHVRNRRLQNLRSWPVKGFEAIRIYFLADSTTMRVIRILHGKQDVRKVLEREGSEG